MTAQIQRTQRAGLGRPFAAIVVSVVLVTATAACNLVAGLDFQLGSGGAVPCTAGAACDDDNPCTADACGSEGICTHQALPDGPAPDGAQKDGDCRTVVCTAGAASAQPEAADIPDDGNSCTTDACEGTAATHTPKPADAPCVNEHGGDGRCDGSGQCQVTCTTSDDCVSNDPCITPLCDTASSACVYPAVPDGTEVPGVAQVPGDCHRRVCVGGKEVVQIDDDDVPPATSDCVVGACTDGQPSSPPKALDTPCDTFADDQAGFCDGAGTCRACAVDSECPGPTDDCKHPACVAFACTTAFAPTMTATTSDPPQSGGDCKKIVCDGSGGTKVVADNADVPIDGDACTTDVCKDGSPSHGLVADGTACGVLQVCLGGQCTGCTSNSQCMAPNTCGGGGTPNVCGCAPKTCAQLGKTCGVVSDGCFGMIDCSDAVKNGTETDVDCGGTTCANKCANGKKCGGDVDCVSGSYCANGTCTLKQANGGACTAALQCQSGFCVDEVCCSTACTGACQACSAGKKQSGNANGTCGNAKNNQPDPRGICSAVPPCGTTGLCSAGACEVTPAGTTCVAASCTGNTLTTAKTCNGMGACNQGGVTAPCANDLLCSGPTACYASCGSGASADDAKCVSTDYCDVLFAKCQDKLPAGSFCLTDSYCLSNKCAGATCE